MYYINFINTVDMLFHLLILDVHRYRRILRARTGELDMLGLVFMEEPD